MTQPKLKHSEFIQAINDLGETSDEFSVRKIEREIEKSKSALGPGTYYVFRAMLATIRKSFEDVISFHEAALRVLPNQWVIGTYAASLARLGYLYKSMEMYKTSYDLDQSDTSYLVSLTNAQVRNALHRRAAAVLEILDEETKSELEIDTGQIEYMQELIQGEHITEEEIVFICSAAEEALFRRKLVLYDRSMLFADSDESFLVFNAAAKLSPSEISDVNVEICDLLAEREPPPAFTGKVIFRVSAST